MGREHIYSREKRREKQREKGILIERNQDRSRMGIKITYRTTYGMRC